MFGFDLDEEKEAMEGSQARFHVRIEKFRQKGATFPVAHHYLWWLTHNAVAHPFLAVAPVPAAFRFHDWTSRKLNAE